MAETQFNVAQVKLDSIVAMKLIRLANESQDFQFGYLQGLIQEETVELTNCYPIPQELEVEAQQIHDKKMMQYSRRHHLDNNKIGIYIIGERLDQFQLENFDLQYRLQSLAKYGILLVYSPQLSSQGHPMPFFAYQINNRFMDLYMRDDIPSSDLQKWNTRIDKIYQQVPIQLNKTPITQSFLYQHRVQLQNKFSHNSLLNNFNLNQRLLIDAIDDQGNAADKINSDALNKKQTSEFDKYTQVNDLIEYFLGIQKVSFLTEQLKKEAKNLLESEKAIHQLSKQ